MREVILNFVVCLAYCDPRLPAKSKTLASDISKRSSETSIIKELENDEEIHTVIFEEVQHCREPYCLDGQLILLLCRVAI